MTNIHSSLFFLALSSVLLTPCPSHAQSFLPDYLKAPNTDPGDRFGVGLAIDGDTLVVGASREASATRTINGDSSDNSAIDAGAAYVFVRSGSTWALQAYLKASNADADDRFGFDVDVSGDTVVVGAHLEKSAGTGVNGNQADNSILHAGAAYVFTRQGTTWTQQAYIKPTNTGRFDFFGGSVSICGDTLVVGSPEEDSDAVGVDGDPFNDNLDGAGACYVFERSGSVWTQSAYIKASNPGFRDYFGTEATLSGNTIVVGAFREDSASSGINGNGADNSSTDSGAAYVFVRSGTTWVQQAYLKASNPGADDQFGYRIAVDGDLTLIGSHFEDSSFGPIDASQTNELAPDSGAVYAFFRSGTTWSQDAFLKGTNTDAGDTFGWSMFIDGDVAIVGAPFEDGSATGVNGDGSTNDVPDSGAAYMFRHTTTDWPQLAYLKASNPDPGDEFGASVALWAGNAFVGAQWEDGAATGVNGDASSNGATDAGAAYVFEEGLEYPSLCIGDGGDQSGCTNCPCMNNAAQGSLSGCLNSSGSGSRISATGDPSVSLPIDGTTDLRFTMTGGPSFATSVLLSGNAVAPTSMASPCFGLSSGTQAFDRDGLRCAVQAVLRHGNRQTNLAGDIVDSSGPNRVWGGEASPPAGLGVSAGILAGQTRYFQVTHRDDPSMVCMRGLNTSQAVEVTFTP